MGKKRGITSGQLDMILDGVADKNLAVEMDKVLGVSIMHRCELCHHRISAEESRAYGIGYDCAAELGRKIWAQRRAERRAAEVASHVEMTQGMSQEEMYAMGYIDDPGIEE